MIQRVKAASPSSNNSKNSNNKKHLLDICLWYDGDSVLFFFMEKLQEMAFRNKLWLLLEGIKKDIFLAKETKIYAQYIRH